MVINGANFFYDASPQDISLNVISSWKESLILKMSIDTIQNPEPWCRLTDVSWTQGSGLQSDCTSFWRMLYSHSCLRKGINCRPEICPMQENGTHPKYSKGCCCTMKTLYIHLTISPDTSRSNRNQQNSRAT